MTVGYIAHPYFILVYAKSVYHDQRGLVNNQFKRGLNKQSYFFNWAIGRL